MNWKRKLTTLLLTVRSKYDCLMYVNASIWRKLGFWNGTLLETLFNWSNCLFVMTCQVILFNIECLLRQSDNWGQVSKISCRATFRQNASSLHPVKRNNFGPWWQLMSWPFPHGSGAQAMKRCIVVAGGCVRSINPSYNQHRRSINHLYPIPANGRGMSDVLNCWRKMCLPKSVGRVTSPPSTCQT